MLLALVALLLDAPPEAEAARPAVTIRLVRPRAQGERLLALFEGTRAPHPAAALAAYKRAKGGDTGLGKAVDAAIASLNPAMVAELATLDDATLCFAPTADGRVAWDAVVPRDDGTFAAYATAAALTDGAPVEPLDGLPVDRLGPRPTASLASRGPGGFLLASSRPALADALRRSRAPLPRPSIDSGWLVHLDPKGLEAAGALTVRRLGVALDRLGATAVDATLRLDGDALALDVAGRLASPTTVAAIPPRWLDAIPAEGTLAAFAVALDPSPTAWAATFDLLDAVERADPARAGVAPLRLRLNLLAGAAGVKPDLDLWPLLVGLSAIVTAGPDGEPDGVLLRLHARDEPSAERLRSQTLPRLLRGSPGASAPLRLRGRAIAIERSGTDVALAWGPSIAERVRLAANDPARSAAPRLRDALGDRAQRFAVAWPGRLPALASPDAPPAVWVGGFDGPVAIDRLRWPGLKEVVRRSLDRLPLDPPPDAATPLLVPSRCD